VLQSLSGEYRGLLVSAATAEIQGTAYQLCQEFHTVKDPPEIFVNGIIALHMLFNKAMRVQVAK
jgi:hypothetical protein